MSLAGLGSGDGKAQTRNHVQVVEYRASALLAGRSGRLQNHEIEIAFIAGCKLENDFRLRSIVTATELHRGETMLGSLGARTASNGFAVWHVLCL